MLECTLLRAVKNLEDNRRRVGESVLNIGMLESLVELLHHPVEDIRVINARGVNDLASDAGEAHIDAFFVSLFLRQSANLFRLRVLSKLEAFLDEIFGRAGGSHVQFGIHCQPMKQCLPLIRIWELKIYVAERLLAPWLGRRKSAICWRISLQVFPILQVRTPEFYTLQTLPLRFIVDGVVTRSIPPFSELGCDEKTYSYLNGAWSKRSKGTSGVYLCEGNIGLIIST